VSYHAVFHGMTRRNLTWACWGSRAFPTTPKLVPCPEPRFRASEWVGRHAWSEDGVEWTYSPYAAWNSTVNFDDGSAISYARRERPHIVTDAQVI
jgi:hypothetical protein